MDRPSWPRQLALGGVIFVATLAVLVGATRLVGPAPDDAASGGSASATPGAATTAGAATPSPSPTGPTTTEPGATAAPEPTSGDDPVLVGAGDIATCDGDGDEATAALLDDLPGTVFTAGDNVYDAGTAEEFAACYDPSWGRHLARTWPAPGNHDWGTPDLAGYRAYFGDTAAGPDGASWYARDLGAWRIIVLDSDCDLVGGCEADSPQGRWLADELATHRPTCSVAIVHHPRFSSGATHGDQPGVGPLWDALYAAGTDVVVSGHEHVYERFAPQDPEGREDRARGIRQFVVGTGGAPLYAFADPRPNSELRLSIAHGVLALTLHPTSYDWRFHAAGSDVADAGSAGCH